MAWLYLTVRVLLHETRSAWQDCADEQRNERSAGWEQQVVAPTKRRISLKTRTRSEPTP